MRLLPLLNKKFEQEVRIKKKNDLTGSGFYIGSILISSLTWLLFLLVYILLLGFKDLHLKEYLYIQKESFADMGKGFSSLLEYGEYAISLSSFID